MINTKELRLGNWVYKVDSNGNKTQKKVFSIQENYVSLEKQRGNPCYKTLVEPIQLTEDILVNSGFEYVKNRYYALDLKNNLAIGFIDGRVLMFLIDGEGDLGFKVMRSTRIISYVHELQNLYYDLTGNELNIIL
ncbi:MAG TPA: hypothetical protein OIM59_09030 [Bacteroides mediterraneensis]|uniref:hypothetical protein n=1 Tax=Bacteroides mediterraneensis TaxID=1841856 RepID=UPI0026EB2FFE|nr:hypothetical protein [Bacteroides mediterraneensis]HJH64754.1 hypothetical protein [Bacteroides mediterraneensis]